ncbi:unnamed protein product, partial [Phaeothamnion confervicola]
RDILSFHIHTNHDVLMETQPPWFKSLILAELLLQWPFYFVAAYALLMRRNWIRIPCIIYGSHVATTMIPILHEFATTSALSDAERLKLILIYCPYLLVPLLLMTTMALDPRPFGDRGGAAVGGVSKRKAA